jgi:hypothetical protein
VNRGQQSHSPTAGKPSADQALGGSPPRLASRHTPAKGASGLQPPAGILMALIAFALAVIASVLGVQGTGAGG